MGYETLLVGSIEISPPLNSHELTYMRKFTDSRRMHRTAGPYFAVPGSNHGQDRLADVLDCNMPPAGQPEVWCDWKFPENGQYIIPPAGWNKFHCPAEWLAYLIEVFLGPGALCLDRSRDQPGWHIPEEFSHFGPHVLNGTITGQGMEDDDKWQITVENNIVLYAEATITYGPGEPVHSGAAVYMPSRALPAPRNAKALTGRPGRARAGTDRREDSGQDPGQEITWPGQDTTSSTISSEPEEQ